MNHHQLYSQFSFQILNVVVVELFSVLEINSFAGQVLIIIILCLELNCSLIIKYDVKEYFVHIEILCHTENGIARNKC